MSAGATILHADLDAFYASVEQMLEPSLRGLPIAVGGGVVLAASYEAREFGVRGGMSGFAAKRLCPRLIFVNGHFSMYQRLGDQVMAILDDFTPLVQRVSIDEAFLDVSGALKLFGTVGQIGEQIRRRVRLELGLPISVGAARTKHLAKIASQVAKPDGIVIVDPDGEQAFLDPLPVGLVWGIGQVTQRHLAGRGITTIGQLANSSDDALRSMLGRALGAKVGALANNEDHRRVQANGRAASVGAQSAFGRRDVTAELVRTVLGHLADRVASRLRAKQRAGRTVTVRVRFADMHAVTRSRTFPDPISATLTLTEVAEELVHGALRDVFGDAPGNVVGDVTGHRRQLSLLAISVSKLVDQPVLQLELPVLADDQLRSGSRLGTARWAIDQSMDAVRKRFGHTAVGYASVTFSEHGSVPDEFRSLAEHEL